MHLNYLLQSQQLLLHKESAAFENTAENNPESRNPPKPLGTRELSTSLPHRPIVAFGLLIQVSFLQSFFDCH